MPEENKNQPIQPKEQPIQKNNSPTSTPTPTPRTTIKRRTAYRLFIGMISQGRPEFRDTRFIYSSINHKETTRVNIFGNIIDKFMSEQKPYGSLTIDDGTGTIRIKTFSDSLNLIKDLNQGDTINVIGKLAYFNDEIYILPEIVKESSITWLIARKLELEKEFGKDIVKNLSDQQRDEQIQKYQQEKEPQSQQPQQQPEQTETTEEKIGTTETETNNPTNQSANQTTNIKDEILNKIKESEPEGIDIDKIIMALNKPVDDINNTITSLLESNEVYEPKPGRLRIL